MRLYKELEAKQYEWDEVQGYYYNIVTHKNVIVLTLEELRELWNTAMERRDRDVWLRDMGKDDYNTAPDFTQYLKEQGLNTIP